MFQKTSHLSDNFLPKLTDGDKTVVSSFHSNHSHSLLSPHHESPYADFFDTEGVSIVDKGPDRTPDGVLRVLAYSPGGRSLGISVHTEPKAEDSPGKTNSRWCVAYPDTPESETEAVPSQNQNPKSPPIISVRDEVRAAVHRGLGLSLSRNAQRDPLREALAALLTSAEAAAEDPVPNGVDPTSPPPTPPT